QPYNATATVVNKNPAKAPPRFILVPSVSYFLSITASSFRETRLLAGHLNNILSRDRCFPSAVKANMEGREDMRMSVVVEIRPTHDSPTHILNEYLATVHLGLQTIGR